MSTAKAIEKAISFGIQAHTDQADKAMRQFDRILKATFSSLDDLAGVTRLYNAVEQQNVLTTQQMNVALGRVQEKVESNARAVLRLTAAAERYRKVGHLPFTEQIAAIQRAEEEASRLEKVYRRLRDTPQARRSQNISDIDTLASTGRITGSEADEARKRIQREYEQEIGLAQRRRERRKQFMREAIQDTKEYLRTIEQQEKESIAARERLAERALKIARSTASAEKNAAFEFKENLRALIQARRAGLINQGQFAEVREGLRAQYQEVANKKAEEAKNKAVAEREKLAQRTLQIAKSTASAEKLASIEYQEQLRTLIQARRQGLISRQAFEEIRGGLRDQLKEQFTAAGTSFMSQFETNYQRVNKQLLQAKSLYNSGKISIHEYKHAVAQLNRELSMSHRIWNTWKVGIMGFIGPLAATYTAINQIRHAYSLLFSLQRAQATMTAYTGNPDVASKIISQLRNLTNLGINFDVSTKSARTFMQYDTAPQDALRYTKQVAQVTGGDVERMDKMALALAQVMGAGRLMGQENIQLVNAGFSPLIEIGKATGESLRDLKKRMEEGGISANEVAQALERATSEGGRFANTLQEIQNTSAGVVTRMQAQWDRFLTNIAGQTNSPLNKMGGALASGLDWVNQMMEYGDYMPSHTRDNLQSDDAISRRIGELEKERFDIEQLNANLSNIILGASWRRGN